MKSLLELRAAADAAAGRLAPERAVELVLRAVARAEATLPADSLVTVHVRINALATLACACHSAELMTAPDAPQRLAARFQAAWDDDARLVAMSRRSLEALGNRWRAGTLAAPSEAEVIYFSRIPGTDAHGAGARLCVFTASDAISCWRLAALDASALRDAHDTLSAVLEADARGVLFPPLPPGGMRSRSAEDPSGPLMALTRVLFETTPLINRTVQQRATIRRDLGLSHAQMNALIAMCQRAQHEAYGEAFSDDAAMRQASAAMMREAGGVAAGKAAAAVAKYGLQRCSLPACAAQEPAARTYKRCSRCSQAYYCCAAHQQDDWRRHKREDGCKKPADAATA